MTNEEITILIQQVDDETKKGNYVAAKLLVTQVLDEIETFTQQESTPMSNQFSESGHLSEDDTKLTSSFAVRAGSDTVLTLRAHALLSLAAIELRRENYDDSLVLAHRGLALTEEGNLELIKPKAWNIFGNIYTSRGSYSTALEYYSKSLAAYEVLGEKSEVSKLTMNIGNVYRNLGSYDKALEYYTKSLTMYEVIGEKWGVATVTGKIGSINQLLGSYDKALECYARALAVHEVLGDTTGIAIVTGSMGNVYYSLGSYDKALEYYGKVLICMEELGDKKSVGGTLVNLGTVFTSLGSNDKALEYFGRALALFDTLGEKSFRANCTGNIGIVYFNIGSYDIALEYFAKALAEHHELGNKSEVANCTGNIGNVYVSLGSYDLALDYLTKALVAHQELGQKSEIARTMGMIANLYTKKKFEGYNVLKAEELLLHAVAISTDIGAKELLVEDYKSLADLYEIQKRDAEALLYFKKHIEIKGEVNAEDIKKQEVLREQQKAIELAKATADAKMIATTGLLHKVLPPSIADRLIKGEKIADYFTSISILFADIVGFTPIASKMPARKVLAFLNYVFGEFDRIIEHHGCEKIKTIGDGYMAVAGAPITCEDHAERIAHAAMEMMGDIQLPEDIRSSLPKGAIFNIRIGINIGPAFGGIVGEKRFVYDIYSDAVNTAARMESHGEPGRIHVSEEFAFHLQNRMAMTGDDLGGIVFEERGEMEIKGKGRMKTYFMERLL
ncbi:MAG: tetratricopeptide repeat protein [Ignavibacteria bacterium]|nr:tetratricopeptide repeat protein [Ignavibacteria bacterium]